MKNFSPPPRLIALHRSWTSLSDLPEKLGALGCSDGDTLELPPVLSGKDRAASEDWGSWLLRGFRKGPGSRSCSDLELLNHLPPMSEYWASASPSANRNGDTVHTLMGC